MEATNITSTYENDVLAQKGKQAAARFLTRRGYEIAERDWSCQAGTIDIIAYDEDGTVCFVETNTRTKDQGMAPDEVSDEKRRTLELIAMAYLAQSDRETDVSVRFDCISLCVFDEDRALLRHHSNILGLM